MIAAWMLFSVACGALVVMAGALLEPVVAAAGRTRRGLWMVVVVCTALVLLLPLVRSAPAVAAERTGRDATAAVIASAVEDGEQAAASLNQAIEWAGRQWSTLQARTDTWDTALVRAWAGVGAALLAFIVIGTRTHTRESRAMPSLTQDALGNEVVLSAVGGPAATGVLRPRILLPPWALDLDPTLRAIVLRHEAEHIAARDPALLLGAVLLLVLLPWHLPLWYAVHRLKIAIEVDCDARVLRAFPDVRRYARLLLLVSQQFHTSTPSFRTAHAGLTTLGSAHSNLRTRILVMTGSPARRFTLASLAQMAGALTVAAAVAAMPAPHVRDAAAASIGADMPLVTGLVVDGADVAALQQPPVPAKPPVQPAPPQPPRVVAPASRRVPPAPKLPATPPEPPSAVIPPTPVPPEPPMADVPPTLPVPPAFEKAPSLIRAKPPLYEVERAMPGQKAKGGEATLYRKQRVDVPRLLPPEPTDEGQLRAQDWTAVREKLMQRERALEEQLRIVRGQIAYAGSYKKPAAFKPANKKIVSPKFKAKSKQPDRKNYEGRRQDTNVVPRR